MNTGICWMNTALILEQVAFPFSRGSSQPRDQTQVSHITGRCLTAEPQGKPKNTGVGSLSLLQWIFLTQESNQVSCIAGGSFTNWAIKKAHAGWGQTISACTEPFLLQWLLIYAPHWSWGIVGRNEVSIQTDPILGRQWWGPKVFKRRHGRCVCVLVTLWPHGL